MVNENKITKKIFSLAIALFSFFIFAQLVLAYKETTTHSVTVAGVTYSVVVSECKHGGESNEQCDSSGNKAAEYAAGWIAAGATTGTHEEGGDCGNVYKMYSARAYICPVVTSYSCGGDYVRTTTQNADCSISQSTSTSLCQYGCDSGKCLDKFNLSCYTTTGKMFDSPSTSNYGSWITIESGGTGSSVHKWTYNKDMTSSLTTLDTGTDNWAYIISGGFKNTSIYYYDSRTPNMMVSATTTPSSGGFTQSATATCLWLAPPKVTSSSMCQNSLDGTYNTNINYSGSYGADVFNVYKCLSGSYCYSDIIASTTSPTSITMNLDSPSNYFAIGSQKALGDILVSSNYTLFSMPPSGSCPMPPGSVDASFDCAPQPGQNLSVNLDYGWVSGASYYKIYRCDSSNTACSFLASTTKYHFLDSLAYAPGTTMYYGVSSVNKSFGESNLAYGSVTQNHCPLPTPVVSASYSCTNNTPSVGLSWNPVAGATSYIVKRDGASLNSVSSSPYLDMPVSRGTSYTYGVVASDGSSDISTSPTAITRVTTQDDCYSSIISQEFVASPSTVNSGGNCGFTVNLSSAPDNSSRCAITDVTGGITGKSYPFTPRSTTNTISTSTIGTNIGTINKETRYKLICWEDGVANSTTTPKYSTCNISPNFIETK